MHWPVIGAEGTPAPDVEIASVTAVPAASGRLASLDVWRGAIVALMAVDHAAGFVGMKPAPEGLAVWGGRIRPQFDGVADWFTRFITHYCAPGFVFLAGVSVVLLSASRTGRGWSSARISGHLALRGVLLVVMEYTLVRWGWGSLLPTALFQVVACIGFCMILGAGLRLVPGPVVLIAGVVLLFGHPLLLDRELVPWLESVPDLALRVLLTPEPLAAHLPTLYPVLPWLSVFLLGMGCGKAVAIDAARTLRWAGVAGVACLGSWLAIRLTDGFAAALLAMTDGWVDGLGTLTPYRSGKGWMDFLMMSKYPPAADFVLWTLGGGLLFLWSVARNDRAARLAWAPLRTFGRVPLFFYVVHLYLYRHLVAATVGEAGLLGATHGSVWLLWAVGLVVLWPACWLFGRLKQRFPGFPLDLF